MEAQKNHAIRTHPLRRRHLIVKGAIIAIVPLVLLIYLNNTSYFSSPRSGSPSVFAHRGIGQRYDIPIESNTCTATHLLPPEHEYLENTIPSMRAAFDRGASVVEFDIRPTMDGRFAVFHDRTLDCKTNGSGLTRAHTMEELKRFDIGYRYTFDGGRTYPFRGKGIGLLPSMDEVFQEFPGRSFLIDVKDNEAPDAALLAEHLSRLPPEQLSKVTIFARDATLTILRERLPSLRLFSVGTVTSCLVRYITYGWTGIIPATCYGSAIFLPINVAPWLWGWPDRFMNRMSAAQSSVILMGAFPGREISPGLDTPANLARIPPNYDGGIWTNELDLVFSSVQRRNGALSREVRP